MALTPEERQAINDLFNRMRENGLPEKDPEAEALINQLIRRDPNSAYQLVQTVLIQEAQFEEYEQYMDDLEARIKELEEQLAGGSRPAATGGFLGGARRAAAPAPRDSYDDQRGSGIPPIGSRTGPGRYDAPTDQPSWRGREPSYAASTRPGGPDPQQQPPQGGGGGFLRTAAAMAAGVAGGALLSNTLGGMFGGNKSGEAHAGQHGRQGDSTSTQNESIRHDDRDNDPGTYDHHQEASDHGSDDWGGDDIEI